MWHACNKGKWYCAAGAEAAPRGNLTPVSLLAVCHQIPNGLMRWSSLISKSVTSPSPAVKKQTSLVWSTHGGTHSSAEKRKKTPQTMCCHNSGTFLCGIVRVPVLALSSPLGNVKPFPRFRFATQHSFDGLSETHSVLSHLKLRALSGGVFPFLDTGTLSFVSALSC